MAGDAVAGSLRSSWLEAFRYDTETQTLNVTTRDGRTYTSIGVPPDVADGLASADSPGRFYLDNIKGQY